MCMFGMRTFLLFMRASVFIFSLIGESTKAAVPQSEVTENGVYIVYMGAAVDSSSSNDAVEAGIAHLMTSVIKRKREVLVHSYTNGFSGFAARLTEEEAQSIAQQPGVVSVFPDPVLHLHTTRSWDFLQSFSSKKDYSKLRSPYSGQSSSSSSTRSDTIIGILDTGIWPESASFSDKGMGPIPTQWKGMCKQGKDFNSSLCNRKIIGAKYYSGSSKRGSPRDHNGHGTHVASTAAGSLAHGASYYGLASGTAKGGSPTSRIAMYQVCTTYGGCLGSDILKGFDDAIKDGVNVLSLSLGGGYGEKTDYSKDPIAIGSFHAVEKGIVVVCSAGNGGPDTSTVVNDAPWILTVAASTLDRHFRSQIILGGNKVIEGTAIQFSKLKKTPVYPLVTGASVKWDNATQSDARACVSDTLNPVKVNGNIIVCENQEQDSFYDYMWMANEVKSAGGLGIIATTSDEYSLIALKFDTFPASMVTQKEGNKILSYISSAKHPVATILPTVTTLGQEPAPAVIFFSSRGPSLTSLNLLKPDITAPGVNILAAWPDDDKSDGSMIPGKNPGYNLESGTSMSCPHISGVAAVVKAHNPAFSVSAIRSAIMTTATQTNNHNGPIRTSSGSIATPYDYGAGQVNPTSALDPGLVYETEIEDYVLFLCATGYNTSQIRLISSTTRKDFECPHDLSPDSISNLNYPSIAISKLNQGETKIVTRKVTNVGDENSVYTATITADRGMDVTVSPKKLVFTRGIKKVTYKVTVTAKSTPKKDIFSLITWKSGKYTVRSPIVVSTE
ncbi:unnamed protein product [Cuscuta europaea]|uniref:Uncharacterized protein n=1 Tax=Cuscuta europaea TaxID=41803 RepID=A0A9P1E3K4_CUSEU|nr:unnamed protein product [Cuscuta europaea]